MAEGLIVTSSVGRRIQAFKPFGQRSALTDISDRSIINCAQSNRAAKHRKTNSHGPRRARCVDCGPPHPFFERDELYSTRACHPGAGGRRRERPRGVRGRRQARSVPLPRDRGRVRRLARAPERQIVLHDVTCAGRRGGVRRGGVPGGRPRDLRHGRRIHLRVQHRRRIQRSTACCLGGTRGYGHDAGPVAGRTHAPVRVARQDCSRLGRDYAGRRRRRPRRADPPRARRDARGARKSDKLVAVDAVRDEGDLVVDGLLAAAVGRRQQGPAPGRERVERRPRDGQTLLGRRPASQLVDDGERVGVHLREDRRCFLHLDGERALSGREPVARAEARQDPVRERGRGRGGGSK